MAQKKRKTVKEKGAEKKTGEKSREDSPAEHILEAVGSIVPGLGKFVKSLGKTDVIKHRLHEVDDELKKRLKEAGQQTGKQRPVVSIGYRVGSIRGEASVLHTGAAKPRAAPKAQEKLQKIVPGKIRSKGLVDVFDEKNVVRIVTELKGVKASDIKIKVKGKTAHISAKGKERKIQLPCVVKGLALQQYKNNILHVTFKK
ncbi:Hsp20/alpha crystallin family protein [Candidatus Woesearchaeota archaeon]|nr:Hsp20/alpha crystallin family protein [Candidatus Woesearchaeota archaeon]